MPLLAVPAVVDHADALLPAAQGLLDQISEAHSAHPDHDISCQAGCTACCSHAVPVNAAELRAVRRAIDQLDPDRRTEIHRRIGEVARALDGAGIDATSFAGSRSTDARNAWSRYYYEQDQPCPLLFDGVCSIRADRPLACREYLVTSDPVHCFTAAPGQVVRIRSRTDVIQGYRRVSATFGEPETPILAMALAEPPRDPGPAAPRSGPRLAQVLTSVSTD